MTAFVINDAPLLTELWEGRKAFRTGVLENPYHPNSMHHREWLRGWLGAFYDNLQVISRA